MIGACRSRGLDAFKHCNPGIREVLAFKQNKPHLIAMAVPLEIKLQRRSRVRTFARLINSRLCNERSSYRFRLKLLRYTYVTILDSTNSFLLNYLLRIIRNNYIHYDIQLCTYTAAITDITSYYVSLCQCESIPTNRTNLFVNWNQFSILDRRKEEKDKRLFAYGIFFLHIEKQFFEPTKLFCWISRKI